MHRRPILKNTRGDNQARPQDYCTAFRPASGRAADVTDSVVPGAGQHEPLLYTPFYVSRYVDAHALHFAAANRREAGCPGLLLLGTYKRASASGARLGEGGISELILVLHGLSFPIQNSKPQDLSQVLVCCVRLFCGTGGDRRNTHEGPRARRRFEIPELRRILEAFVFVLRGV